MNLRRLYHSVAWLTQNAEVLISGSEVTSDYTAQVGLICFQQEMFGANEENPMIFSCEAHKTNLHF